MDQGNTVVSKTSDGTVRYDADAAAGESSVQLNTITTPRGGVYRLTLADHTHVWLNAASSITYPVAFSGHERQVSITGEVYFEVAHNAEKPFIVTGKGQQIEVLGTLFNVNTYENEPENKTTLLQGSVRIMAGKHINILKPGQQAVFSGNNIRIKDADIIPRLSIILNDSGLFL
jgi:transmembrane sensor